MNVQALTALVVAGTSFLGAALALYHAITAKQQVRQQAAQQPASGPAAASSPPPPPPLRP